MKTLRHRYLAIRAIKFPNVEDPKSLLVEVMLSKLRERPAPSGPIGFRFRVIELDDANLTGIVRISPHTASEKVKKLLSSIDQFQGQTLEIRILGASGTLRALRRKYINQRSEDIPKVIKVHNRLY